MILFFGLTLKLKKRGNAPGRVNTTQTTHFARLGFCVRSKRSRELEDEIGGGWV